MITSRYRIWLESGQPEDLEAELAPLLPALGRRARRLLPRPADADDAVQDALLELLRTRERLPAELPLPALVQRLLTERVLMQGRRNRVRLRREEPLSEAAAPVTAEDTVADVDMQALLKGLRPCERDLLEGLATGEPRLALARRLGTSAGALSQRLHRLRTRLSCCHRSGHPALAQ